MTTPLRPEISVGGDTKYRSVCNCCGSSLDTMCVNFMWRENQGRLSGKQGGGTSVVLCRDCRRTTILRLTETL